MSGKRYASVKKKTGEGFFGIDEAVKKLAASASAKFDETIDIAARLGVDPKHPEQMVRGSVVLPNGTGKKVKILVIAKGEKLVEAKESGADFFGGEDMIEKVLGGWLEFDKMIATPDIMGMVSKLGKVLGPKGLMPNPKLGTVTFDVKKAVSELRAGKVEFKIDKSGIVHAPFGKASFGAEKLKVNFIALMEAIMKAKPSSSKGAYLKSLYVSATMGPSVGLDTNEIKNVFN